MAEPDILLRELEGLQKSGQLGVYLGFLRNSAIQRVSCLKEVTGCLLVQTIVQILG